MYSLCAIADVENSGRCDPYEAFERFDGVFVVCCDGERVQRHFHSVLLTTQRERFEARARRVVGKKVWRAGRSGGGEMKWERWKGRKQEARSTEAERAGARGSINRGED